MKLVDLRGTCKNLTGTEYVSSNQSQKYCGDVPKNPSKVKHSTTTDGLKVSGSLPGRSKYLDHFLVDQPLLLEMNLVLDIS